MTFSKFVAYNIGGAILWTVLFVGAGFFFGAIPAVQVSLSRAFSSASSPLLLWYLAILCGLSDSRAACP
jgi:membrane protein DedA with SNARE-associated domain